MTFGGSNGLWHVLIRATPPISARTRVRCTPASGAIADLTKGPSWADAVEKVGFCCDHRGLTGIENGGQFGRGSRLILPGDLTQDPAEGSKRKGFQVLYDGREMKFVTRTGEPSEPHAFETVLGLEMGKPHLYALALISRLEEALCPHQPSRNIAGIFMTSLDTCWAAMFGQHRVFSAQASQSNNGGTVAEHVAVVPSAGGVQHFVVWTNVDAAMLVPAEVAAGKCAVIALALRREREYVERSGGQPANRGNGPFRKRCRQRAASVSN
jgi:hypothetical protein